MYRRHLITSPSRFRSYAKYYFKIEKLHAIQCRGITDFSGKAETNKGQGRKRKRKDKSETETEAQEKTMDPNAPLPEEFQTIIGQGRVINENEEVDHEQASSEKNTEKSRSSSTTSSTTSSSSSTTTSSTTSAAGGVQFPMVHNQWADLFQRAHKVAEYPAGSLKIWGIFQYTTLATLAPLYVICLFFPVPFFSTPEFMCAWLVNKASKSMWYKPNERLSLKIIKSYPDIEQLKWSFTLPDSKNQDPATQVQGIARAMDYGYVVADQYEQLKTEAKSSRWEYRRQSIKGYIKYGLAWDMAENVRSIYYLPLCALAFKMGDLTTGLQEMGLYSETIVQFGSPAVACFYFARFLAPFSFKTAVDKAEASIEAYEEMQKEKEKYEKK